MNDVMSLITSCYLILCYLISCHLCNAMLHYLHLVLRRKGGMGGREERAEEGRRWTPSGNWRSSSLFFFSFLFLTFLTFFNFFYFRCSKSRSLKLPLLSSLSTYYARRNVLLSRCSPPFPTLPLFPLPFNLFFCFLFHFFLYFLFIVHLAFYFTFFSIFVSGFFFPLFFYITSSLFFLLLFTFPLSPFFSPFTLLFFLSPFFSLSLSISRLSSLVHTMY